jgi:hypothetical protein
MLKQREEPEPMTLSQVAMVEDALKFYFEKATLPTSETLTWADTYKKVVVLKELAVENYRNRDN